MLKILKEFEVAHIYLYNFKLTMMTFDDITIFHVGEFTFLRKDRVKEKHPVVSLPHPLDQPNLPSKGGDIIVPRCWYT